MADLNQREIKIVSISTPEAEEVPYSNPAMVAKVVFQIRKDGPKFPVYVGRDIVSDENLIRVARHYLHVQAHDLAEATAAWRLSDEEYKQAVPQKIPPNTGHVIPR
jgi:hypothetical protein